MQVKFSNKKLESLYTTGYGKGYGRDIIEGFIVKINIIKNAKCIKDLINIRSLHFEKLAVPEKGIYSIRVNLHYRIEFDILETGTIQIIDIVALTNHYQ